MCQDYFLAVTSEDYGLNKQDLMCLWASLRSADRQMLLPVDSAWLFRVFMLS